MRTLSRFLSIGQGAFRPALCYVLLISLLFQFPNSAMSIEVKKKELILAGGCFWCTEAIYRSLKGITQVESGYTAGYPSAHVPPKYEEVARGDTGFAEAIRITYDPHKIGLSELLTVFFHTHDPTTKNQQGADRGTQYRSIAFFANSEEEAVVREVISKLEKEKLWGDKPFVTEVLPISVFYKAEEYHQKYYERNKGALYCSIVIAPKLQKLYREFQPLLRQDAQEKVGE